MAAKYNSVSPAVLNETEKPSVNVIPNILRTADSTSQDRRIPAGRPAMKAVPAIIRFSYKNNPAIVLAGKP